MTRTKSVIKSNKTHHMHKKYKSYDLRPSFRVTILVSQHITFETAKPIIEKELHAWKKEQAHLFPGISDTDLKREYASWWFDHVYEQRVQILLATKDRNKVKGKFIAYMMADFQPKENPREKMHLLGQTEMKFE